MRFPQYEHPEAAAGFDAAVRWYEAQAPDLGLDLIHNAELTRDRIGRWPDTAAPVASGVDGTVVRGAVISGYPLRVISVRESDALIILAYAHERRRPGYWRARRTS